MLHEQLTSKIIKCFFHVYHKLGYGFLEKVYENALRIELEKAGLEVTAQQRIKVFYDSLIVGDYFADLVVERKVIIELKAAENICPEFEQQLLNYLKATEIELGLLFNFGLKPGIKRLIFTNDRKYLIQD